MTDYALGDVTFTFSKNGKLNIVNVREDQSPFRSQTANYTLTTVDCSIYDHESRTALTLSVVGSLPYIMDFNGELLYLSPNAYDGGGYTLQKVEIDANEN
ncbi:MAG: hypothetical protein E7070_12280 [Bacteroidales bacterium]|jgi:hypothetical protein|nr:hypothetical protein [Bacteroidales bacterium]